MVQIAWKKEISIKPTALPWHSNMFWLKKIKLWFNHLLLLLLQYGRSDSYRVATTQDKDEKESPKKKGGKDLDDLKKEVPIVCTDHTHTKYDV